MHVPARAMATVGTCIGRHKPPSTPQQAPHPRGAAHLLSRFCARLSTAGAVSSGSASCGLASSFVISPLLHGLPRPRRGVRAGATPWPRRQRGEAGGAPGGGRRGGGAGNGGRWRRREGRTRLTQRGSDSQCCQQNFFGLRSNGQERSEAPQIYARLMIHKQ